MKMKILPVSLIIAISQFFIATAMDVSPPSKPIVKDDGDFTNSKTRLRIIWSPSGDPETGISGYEYAIGTTPGGIEVLNWKTTNKAAGINVTGLNLANEETYYFAVKAVNGEGLYSEVGISDGIEVMFIRFWPAPAI